MLARLAACKDGALEAAVLLGVNDAAHAEEHWQRSSGPARLLSLRRPRQIRSELADPPSELAPGGRSRGTARACDLPRIGSRASPGLDAHLRVNARAPATDNRRSRRPRTCAFAGRCGTARALAFLSRPRPIVQRLAPGIAQSEARGLAGPRDRIRRSVGVRADESYGDIPHPRLRRAQCCRRPRRAATPASGCRAAESVRQQSRAGPVPPLESLPLPRPEQARPGSACRSCCWAVATARRRGRSRLLRSSSRAARALAERRGRRDRARTMSPRRSLPLPILAEHQPRLPVATTTRSWPWPTSATPRASSCRALPTR